jgi:hypothetical protein
MKKYIKWGVIILVVLVVAHFAYNIRVNQLAASGI